MAPRFRPWKPSKKLVPSYEAARDQKSNPARIAYELSHDAARIMVYASKKGRTEHQVANGYVARHLVEKGCLRRIPGRKSSYSITLRGEAVVEELRNRKMMQYLFTDIKPPEL